MAITVQMDDEFERTLAMLAEHEGLRTQEIICGAALDRHERASHAQKVADSTRRMVGAAGRCDRPPGLGVKAVGDRTIGSPRHQAPILWATKSFQVAPVSSRFGVRFPPARKAAPTRPGKFKPTTFRFRPSAVATDRARSLAS